MEDSPHLFISSFFKKGELSRELQNVVGSSRLADRHIRKKNERTGLLFLFLAVLHLAVRI